MGNCHLELWPFNCRWLDHGTSTLAGGIASKFQPQFFFIDVFTYYILYVLNKTAFLHQGKSLSLICGALTWLRDFEEKTKLEAAQLLEDRLPQQRRSQDLQNSSDAGSKESEAKASGSEFDWVTEFVQKKAERDLVDKLKVISEENWD